MTSTPAPSLQHLSVGAFAMVMGIGGVSAAWNQAASAWDLPTGIGMALAWAGVGVFAALLVAYGIKAARFPREVAAEWRHPIRTAFTATIPIAALVTSVALLPHHEPTSAALWWAGASGMSAVTLWVMRTWTMDAQLQHTHVHPAWFIPVVGNIVAPLAGVAHAPAALSWYFFGVGILYWLGLLPIVLTRLFVHGVIPPRLAPTLAIMVAPPAIGAIAWVRLGGTWDDAVARILLAVTVFNVLALVAHADSLVRVPFALPSWAYTFPLAGAAVAFIAAGAAGAGSFYTWAGAVVLAAASLLVALLGVLTARGFVTRALLLPEG